MDKKDAKSPTKPFRVKTAENQKYIIAIIL